MAAADVYYSHIGDFGHFGVSEQISHKTLLINLMSLLLTLSINLPSQDLTKKVNKENARTRKTLEHCMKSGQS